MEFVMFGFGKNQIYSIGIDMSPDGLRLAQLVNCGRDVGLVAGSYENCPDTVKGGTAAWQRWAVNALKRMVVKEPFKGKSAKVAIPAGDVYIESVKLPKKSDSELEDALFARIKSRIPSGCTRENTMIKYVPTDQDNALVLATDRETINRYLAVYERAGLDVKAISVWPEALIQCYTNFFGRRKSDTNAIVMLLDIEKDCTNLVICRYNQNLFSRSIPISASSLSDENAISRLVLEVTACRRDFVSLYRNAAISRLIFLSGPVVATEVYANIARQLEVQAQIGDCLIAVEMSDAMCHELDRRDIHINWATAFGLSLS
jgi:Tfp pilus assembly PilM family ATPase